MIDERYSEFLDRLWALEAAAGLNDSQLAQRLGVQQSYVSRLRSGKRGHRLSLNIVGRAVAVFPELSSFLPS